MSAWAFEAVKWSVGSGLVVGRPGMVLAPEDTVSRAETAVLILRLLRIAGLVDVRDVSPRVAFYQRRKETDNG